MKRIIFVLLILSASTVFAQNPSAVIKEMAGTVELQRAGSANWVAARAGDRIDVDTIVSTGFKSMAVLEIGSSILTVRPITRLSLKELVSQNETETVNISLNTGRIRVEVNPPAGSRANLSVQSPSATASVRGTSFDMDATSITVITGAVSFEPADSVSRPVTVSAGQSTVVDVDSGAALSPMAAAEVSGSLPVLAGQLAGQGVIISSSSGTPMISRDGSLALQVGLNDGNE